MAIITDLGTMIVNAKEVFVAFEDLIPYVAALIGSIFIMQGLLRLSKLADGRGDVTTGQVISSWIFGGLLLNFAKTKLLAGDVFALSGGLSYTPSTGSSYTDQVISAVLVIVSAFGVYSVFSGLLDAKKAGDGKGGGGDDLISKAFWKFVGGAIAMNLGSFFN